MLSTHSCVMQARYNQKTPLQFACYQRQHHGQRTQQNSEDFFPDRARNCRFLEQIVSVLREDLLKWTEISF